MKSRTSRNLWTEKLESRHLLHGADEISPVLWGEGEATAMPDFTLTDVNSGSATANQGVSPRDYLQQVSGWYFGTAM
ncbi:MAG: hypothetical protein ACYC6N_05860 [Pirellulaceae bacterium]